MKKIGIIGDFNPAYYTHLAINDAVNRTTKNNGIEIVHDWIHTTILRKNLEGVLNIYNGFWLAPSTPYANTAGVIDFIKMARENDFPLLATCGGFQHMILEFARNVIKISDVEHEENNPNAEKFIINKLSCSLVGKTENLRVIDKDSTIYKSLRIENFSGSYYCNYGLNRDYQEIINKNGLNVTVVNAEGYARAIESKKARFYVGTLFQPQLHSEIDSPNPIISAFFDSLI